MMKKLLVLFLSLTLGSAVSSCSKDEDTGIEGKWTYDTRTYTDAEGTSESELAYDSNCTDRKYFYFKPKGVFELGWVNASNNPKEPCKFFKYDGGKWRMEDNKIITSLAGDNQESKVTFVSVSSTNLVFRHYQTQDEYFTYTLKKTSK